MAAIFPSIPAAEREAFFADVDTACKKAIWCALATVTTTAAGAQPRVRIVHPTWEGDTLWGRDRAPVPEGVAGARQPLCRHPISGRATRIRARHGSRPGGADHRSANPHSRLERHRLRSHPVWFSQCGRSEFSTDSGHADAGGTVGDVRLDEQAGLAGEKLIEVHPRRVIRSSVPPRLRRAKSCRSKFSQSVPHCSRDEAIPQ